MAKITAVDENAKVEDATVEETVTPVEDVVVEPEETIDSDFSVDNTEESYDEDVMPLPSGEEDATPVYNGDVAQQSSETIGKKWNEYTTGTDLDDTDEFMILDTSAKANKRTLLSKLADYVLGKLADKVFEKLETQNKTILGALNELNSKAQIDTSEIYYQDSEFFALGGIDACVKDAVTKNRFPKNGTFFKNFIAGSRYLAVGYRYENGTYGLIVLYKFGMKLDYRYSIEKGILSKIS